MILGGLLAKPPVLLQDRREGGWDELWDCSGLTFPLPGHCFHSLIAGAAESWGLCSKLARETKTTLLPAGVRRHMGRGNQEVRGHHRLRSTRKPEGYWDWQGIVSQSPGQCAESIPWSPELSPWAELLLGPPLALELILLGASKSASPLQPLPISPDVSLLSLCSSILPSAVISVAARPISSFYQAKIFHFFMHSSHTVWLSLFFPQVPWCYLFLFLISYVLRHILPFCLLFLKPQLHFTFETKRFIYINLKKCLEKHIKAKKQTWKHNEMCCWDGKGLPEQSAPVKSIKRGLILISKWYLIHSSGFSLKDLYS